MSDDSLVTSTELLLVSTLSDSLSAGSDVDYVKLSQLSIGSGYRVVFQPDSNLKGYKAELISVSVGGEVKVLSTAGTDKKIDFSLVQAGDYFIRITGGKTSLAGSYTLNLYSDDYSSDASTLGQLAFIDNTYQASGQFSWSGDKDWLKFSPRVENNQTGVAAGAVQYKLSITDEAGNALAASKASVRLLDSKGAVVSSGLKNGDLLSKVISGNSYYLEIVDTGSNTPAGTSYKVSVLTTITDDFGATKTSAGWLDGTLISTSTPVAVTGALESAGDKDWIKIDNLSASAGYTFSVQQADVKEKLHLDLYSSTGSLLSKVDAVNGVATLNYGGSNAVYVAVSDNAKTVGGYSVNVSQIVDDYGVLGGLPLGSLSENSPALNGAIQWGADHDVIKLTGGSAQEWKVVLTPASSALGMSAKFVDGTGVALTGSNIPTLKKTGSDWVASFKTPTSTLFKSGADAQAYLDIASTGNSVGAYSLRLYSDDYAADSSTLGQLTSSVSAAAVIATTNTAIGSGEFAWAGDKDWLKFNPVSLQNQTGVAAGAVQYTLSVADAEGHALNSSQVSVRLLDSKGSVVMSGLKDGSLLNKVIAGSNYYFEIADIGKTSLAGTGYKLVVNSAITDDFGASKTTAGLLDMSLLMADNPVTVNGRLEVAGDSDWFKLSTINAGAPYEVHVAGLDSTLKNYTVKLYDSNGSAIAAQSKSATDGSVLLSYTPTTTGSIFVSVQGGSGGASVGTYSVSVSGLSDDGAAGVTTALKTTALDSGVEGKLNWAGDVDWVGIGAGGVVGQEWRVLLSSYGVYGANDSVTPDQTLQAKFFDASGQPYKLNNQQVSVNATTVDAYDTSVYSGAITLAAPKTDLFVAVSSSANHQDAIYNVSMLTDDYRADTGTSLAFDKNGSGWFAEGRFAWVGDKDWAKLVVTDSSLLNKSLQLVDSNNTDFDGMQFAVFKSDGSAYTAASAINTNHTFSVSSLGTYFIQIENTSINVGDYQIQLIGV